MRHAALVIALLATLFVGTATAEEVAPKPVQPKKAPPQIVDFVICLDTSGSMSGLINAARQKLWSVVSEIAMLEPEPKLRVALLTYGSPGHPKRGDVVVQTDLTDNLDLVSEKLFALGTNGGTELVGRVLHYSLKDLNWSKSAGLKTIFVAGNESADQDTAMKVADMTRAARARGIFVNAIYCGNADDGDAESWRRVAHSGMGRFSNIDHNHGTVNIKTPFDKELATLSAKINTTYVWYGKARKLAEARQIAQDANASNVGAPAAAQRAEAKASSAYHNVGDLIDQSKREDFDLAKVPVADLPEAMRTMDLEARQAYLVKKRAERTEIQARIKDLSAKRAAFVKKTMEEEQLDDSRSLDRALREAISEQARQRGFSTK